TGSAWAFISLPAWRGDRRRERSSHVRTLRTTSLSRGILPESLPDQVSRRDGRTPDTKPSRWGKRRSLAREMGMVRLSLQRGGGFADPTVRSIVGKRKRDLESLMLGFIQGSNQSMERTPKAFARHGEQAERAGSICEMRQVFLPLTPSTSSRFPTSLVRFA